MTNIRYGWLCRTLCAVYNLQSVLGFGKLDGYGGCAIHYVLCTMYNVFWVLVSQIGGVGVLYTLCCVQCVLGFGKSDRWGGACGRRGAHIGEPAPSLPEREREGGTVTTREHAHCARELSPNRFDGQHMTRTCVTLSFSRRVPEVSWLFVWTPLKCVSSFP